MRPSAGNPSATAHAKRWPSSLFRKRPNCAARRRTGTSGRSALCGLLQHQHPADRAHLTPAWPWSPRAWLGGIVNTPASSHRKSAGSMSLPSRKLWRAKLGSGAIPSQSRHGSGANHSVSNETTKAPRHQLRRRGAFLFGPTVADQSCISCVAFSFARDSCTSFCQASTFCCHCFEYG